MNLIWKRRITGHATNFDLVLVNPEDLDSSRAEELLAAIMRETHRQLSLSGRAYRELKAFFNRPTSALRASSYALLSNWFTTRGGDKNSMVASRCEALWDEMFQSRPLERLTSPTAGQNHIVLPSEFASFWDRLSRAQGSSGVPSASPQGTPPPIKHDPSPATPLPNSPAAALSSTPPAELDDEKDLALDEGETIHAVITRDGMHIDVKGSPQAIASFLDH